MFSNWKITKEQLNEVRYQIELYDAQHWCQTFPEYYVQESEEGYEVIKGQKPEIKEEPKEEVVE